MKIIPVLIIILVAAIAVIVAIGVKGGFEPGSTPLPTVTMSCNEAKNGIQAALDAYHVEHTEWPTANGQPGDIAWTKLVPDFMAAVPYRCDWRVNSDPVGEVCLQRTC